MYIHRTTQNTVCKEHRGPDGELYCWCREMKQSIPYWLIKDSGDWTEVIGDLYNRLGEAFQPQESTYEVMTGFKNIGEFEAYELGKEHNQMLVDRAIEKWDGIIHKSILHQLLMEKFNELNNK